jgi:hypothetical protein
VAPVRHRRLRPAATTTVDDRLKLHRHVLRLDGRPYTVVTLRPGLSARFATNRYHDTWHVLSDPFGARLLARLCWGLSFQRRPDTIVLLDRRFLDSNPFDAAPSDPVALVNAHLGRLSADAARALRAHRWPIARPAGTLRWHTFGLVDALDRDRFDAPPPVERIQRSGGVLVCTAPPANLRRWAVNLATLGRQLYRGTNHLYLNGSCIGADGEVQIFDRYRRMVSVAREARREVPAGPDLEQRIWARCDTVWRRRSCSTVDG